MDERRKVVGQLKPWPEYSWWKATVSLEYVEVPIQTGGIVVL